jgi:hypothetical protein
MTGRTLRVKCSSWDQVESFYMRKLRRGRGVTIKVPFVPAIGDPIAVGLELPSDLVVVIDGAIASVQGVGEDRAQIDIDLHGLTAAVVDRLEKLVADGRGAVPPALEPYAGDAAQRIDDPAHQRVVQLDAELRRLRQLAVHEVLGVPWDATAIEVRAGWRRLCQEFHPDVVATHASAAVSHLAEELMILVNRAYDRMRASLVSEGRAAAHGPALRPEKGWLVAFDAISTGEVRALEPPEGPTETRRRHARESGTPTVSFGKTTEHVFDELAVASGAPEEASLAQARSATDNVFEKQARQRLQAGDHEAAREVLAAALYVYPRNQSLRALYHVASAMQALDAGQGERAASQLEAALSADPGCVEARAALDDLRRRLAAGRIRP